MAHPLQDFVHKSVDQAGLAALGYQAQDGEQGADRHGAWEWTYVARAPERERFAYVTIGAMETHQDRFALEVWGGASDARRFGRLLIGEFEESRANIYVAWHDKFATLLRDAGHLGLKFPEHQMHAVYAGPV